jgi:hypothetical protein
LRDPHLNVFHAYRGPGADADRQAQLEDNLTRALVVTLVRLRGTAAAGPILDALKVPRSGRGTCDVRLQLGRLPESYAPQPDTRIVLVHAGPKLELDPSPVWGRDRGRPDAVFFGREWTVALEAKLGNRVGHDQIEGHRRTLRAPHAEQLSVTWLEVAEAVRATRRRVSKESTEDFLLQQFEEYLAMTGFGGLVEEQFAYLALAPKDREKDSVTKDGIRRSLGTLAETVREAWAPKWVPHIGKVLASSAGAWATVGPPGAEEAHPHLTIGLSPAGIDIFANIETEGPWRMFRDALRRAPNDLVGFLQALDPPGNGEPRGWRLEVVRRVNTGRPRDFWTPPALTIGAGAIGNLPADALLAMLDAATAKPSSESAPEVMVLRRYDAAAVVRRSELPDWLVADAKALTPFFEWLGVSVK